MSRDGAIDRRALVARHDVVRTVPDLRVPLQVGNGRFAAGLDVTGLQSLAPFACLSEWGWHSAPPPPDVGAYRGRVWDTHGRAVRYPDLDPDHPKASRWLRENPHRLNLGRIGFVLPGPITRCRQHLDLWAGVVSSRFELDGAPVEVTTCCHPVLDALAVRVRSPLLANGALSVFLDFPYGDARKFAEYVGDWNRPLAHRTEVVRRAPGRVDLLRRLDGDRYHVAIAWSGSATFIAPGGEGDHRHILRPADDSLDVVYAFSPGPLPDELPSAAETVAASRRHWAAFWQSGGAVDLSACTDPRAPELERRVVLSQYVMAVNETGALPPQESGLVSNGWYGKGHFEMCVWHAAHWALWDRWPILRRGLETYERLLPGAIERAAEQGFLGARWPKCAGPDGREAPGEIHALLIWQQPHVCFFAELDYGAHPSQETLRWWAPILEATADFLGSYAAWDEPTHRYVLGPPLHVVSENTDPARTRNPAFELAYWRFGLTVAQRWRERMGRPRSAGWDRVLDGLSPLPVEDGCYVLHEGVKRMWEERNYEHPSVLGLLGLLPGPGVDQAIMRRTAERVLATWRWEEVWGWDFPMAAMCAARLGWPERAIDLLLHESERFQFTDAGLATGGPFPYLPSNGSLLYAVAMLCAGWEGSQGRSPGFPARGWDVRWEGLRPAL